MLFRSVSQSRYLPYMGGKGMNASLKEFAKKQFPDSKSDLFAMFIERGFDWCKPNGFNSMVTMQSWMFLSSYESLREKLFDNRTINTMAHLGARAFPEISGAVVCQQEKLKKYRPVFFRLVDGNDEQKETILRSNQYRFDKAIQDDFMNIPGKPIAYWVTSAFLKAFEYPQISEFTKGEGKNVTADNDRFLRRFWEVSANNVGRGLKWIIYAKGGEYRKWTGNLNYICDWSRERERESIS